MKKIFLLVLLALPTLLFGQTITENYVKNTTYQVPVTTATQSGTSDSDKLETVSYFDGLGRPTQSVSQRAGGTGRDIISIQEYDALGRSPKQYLPVHLSANGGDYRTSDLKGQINSYYSTEYPEDIINPGVINAYSEVQYDGSWESRPIEQGAPGASWKLDANTDNDHTLKREYSSNTVSVPNGSNYTQGDDVIHFQVSYVNNNLDAPTLSILGLFNENELFKSITKDENWTPTSDKDHTTEQYTNKRGQLLLKRTYNDNLRHDTYYIYNHHDNLTFVLPPNATDTVLQNVSYGDFEQFLPYTLFATSGAGSGPNASGGISFHLEGNLLTVDADLTMDPVQNLRNGTYGALTNLPNTTIGNLNIFSTQALYDLRIQDGYFYVSGTGLFSSKSKSYTVLLPQLTGDVDHSIIAELGYEYHYDYRNRVVEKKVPQKGWEYMAYDKLDRPVLVQDARMRINDQWLFTKYDAFNRPVYTGLYEPSAGGADLTSIQNTVDAQSNLNESRSNSPNPNTIGDGSAYYSNTVFPTNDITLHTVSYFDMYTGEALAMLPSSVYNENMITTVKSLPTSSKVRVLGTTDWITTVTGYDYKRRPIFVATENAYLDTNDTSESLLDFMGKVLESRTTHQKTNQPTIVTKDYFTYDHQQRLLAHMQQIDDQPLQLISNNEYDEIGQLVTKDVGGQLFESGYADISSYITVDDNIIEKTSGGSASFNAGLATVGQMEGDGGVSFTVGSENKRLIVGLNNQSNTDFHTEIDYGISMFWQNPPKFISQIRENDTLISLHNHIEYAIGDTFAIEREGNVVHFIHNGTEVATYTMTQNYTSLVGDISMKDEGAQISNFNLYATTINNSLQEVDYQYNIRGWMTDINDVDAPTVGNKLFNFRINYNQAIEGSSSTQGVLPLYNGNISQTSWATLSTDKDLDKRSYGYQYDALNRLEAAYSYKGTTLTQLDKYGLQGIDYDKNGNINTLLRYGYTANAIEVMDQLVYNYLGNQLQNVTDLSTDTIKNEGFYDGNDGSTSLSLDDYEYDVNGNMIIDRNKGISNITYNHLNLPVVVTINTFDDGQGQAQQGSIQYVYDATGIKLEKQVTKQSQPIVFTRYAGSYIYEHTGGFESLQMFSHPEGYLEPEVVKGGLEYQYVFTYTDHLGNVRLTYKDSNGNGTIEHKTEVISEKHYYPFGLQHSGYNDVVTSNSNPMAEKFAFGGKEYGEELGLDWYDISARNYDPALGRWMNIDPLAEQMRRHSPYNYAFDNPVLFLDADGMSPITTLFKGGTVTQAEIQNSAFGRGQISGGAPSLIDGVTGEVLVNDLTKVDGAAGSSSSSGSSSGGNTSSSASSGGDPVKDAYFKDYFEKISSELTEDLEGITEKYEEPSWVESSIEWVGDHSHELITTFTSGLNAYAGYVEFQAGLGLMALPTGVSQVGGAYLIGDGSVRMISAPLQIYGVWTGNEALEYFPSNLLGGVGTLIDSSREGQWTTGGVTQTFLEVAGDFGMSKRRLILAATKNVENLSKFKKYKRAFDILNEVTQPYRRINSKAGRLDTFRQH